MYKSPTTFIKGCKYVMLNLWDMLEGRTKRKKQKARVIRQRESWRKETSWSKVKISWLAFIVTCYEECEREKRKKRWRNKRRGHSVIWRCEEKKWSPKVWGLVQSWRTAWVRASRREKKNRESERKYIGKKRAVSEKKNGVFFLFFYYFFYYFFF